MLSKIVIRMYILQKHDVTHEVAGNNALSAVVQQVLTSLLIQPWLCMYEVMSIADMGPEVQWVVTASKMYCRRVWVSGVGSYIDTYVHDCIWHPGNGNIRTRGQSESQTSLAHQPLPPCCYYCAITKNLCKNSMQR